MNVRQLIAQLEGMDREADVRLYKVRRVESLALATLVLCVNRHLGLAR